MLNPPWIINYKLIKVRSIMIPSLKIKTINIVIILMIYGIGNILFLKKSRRLV